MAKDTFYFSHDHNARSDKELLKVRMKLGMTGIGIYWCIIEMLHEEGGYLMRSECERIAFELQTDELSIKMLIENFKLFKFDEEKFWSESAILRLEKREDKRVKASKAAFKKWENAKAMQTHSEGNAIKERKGKEIVEKDINTDSLTKPEKNKNGNSYQQFKSSRAQGAEILANRISGKHP